MNTIDLSAGDIESKSSETVNNQEQLKVEEYNLNKEIRDLENSPKIEVTLQEIDESELKLKGRIAECRSIIESLKLELREEKDKQDDRKIPSKMYELSNTTLPTSTTNNHEIDTLELMNDETSNFTLPTSISSNHRDIDNLDLTNSLYHTYIDSKLNYGVNINEYEKQLEKYQNTLNMAQTEKKNAIRKHMLAKAFKLKLLEVENQCNIELLRVKQSLQCLEPLKMIASKWKSSSDDLYDTNNFELMPRFPEFATSTGYDHQSLNPDVIENSPH